MNFEQSFSYIAGKKFPSKLKFAGNPAERFENFKAFLKILKNPENKIPKYIHVTGTSGKGSTCIMLASILKSAGKKVGLMTSPHLTEITERWQINGKQMPRQNFILIIERIKKTMKEFQKTTKNKLTFFDLTTAVGLLYFAEKKVDWAVMEVGCGGRYDSTNAIPHKAAAVITNIDLDHTDILGKTRKKIAYEKAGIIKKGGVAFTGETNAKILKIFKNECAKNDVRLEKKSTKPLQYSVPAIGAHQIENAELAVKVSKFLKIPKSAIEQGLASAKFPVRMEIVAQKPFIILDGAHNAREIEATVRAVKSLDYGDLCMIVGFSEGKNSDKMISELIKLNPKIVACTKQGINSFRKAIQPIKLAEKFKTFGISAKTFNNAEKALDWCKKRINKNSLLLATGSMFLAGELRGLLKNENSQN
ncbi:MAG: Mur ligase family protein [Patescibacteria group bacterium]